MAKLEERAIWPELVSLKDDLSLRQLAERFGVATGTVKKALDRNGITRRPAKSGRRSKKSVAEVEARLALIDELPPEAGVGKRRLVRPNSTPAATAAPRKAAKKSGKRGAKPKKALLEPFMDLLGKRSDSDVAGLSGLNARTVAKYRNEAGIPPFKRPAGAPRKRRKGRRKQRASKIDAFVELLGTITDAEVAAQAGTTAEAVRVYRTKRGIPSLRARRRSGDVVAPTVAAAAPIKAAKIRKKGKRAAAPRSGAIVSSSQAWRVTLGDGQSVIVVAGDLVGMAQVLAQSGRDASRIKALGPVLI